MQTIPHQPVRNVYRRFQNFRCGNPNDFDALFSQQCIAPIVVSRPIAHIMHDAIDFDAYFHLRAIEIENIRADWVLSAEFDFILLAQL